MEVSHYRSDIQEIISELGSIKYVSPESAIEKCDHLLEYGENRRDNALIGFAHFTKGEVYYFQNDIPLFYLEMLKCMKPLEMIREWGYLAASYNLLGIIALNRGNAPLAMDYYFKAYNFCVEHKLPDLKRAVFLNIGHLYIMIDKPDEALSYFEDGHKFILDNKKSEGYYDELSAVLVGKGQAYIQKEEMEKAWAVKNEIESTCLSGMSDTAKLVYSCFVSRLAFLAKDVQTCMEHMGNIRHGLIKEHPIMDIFDDVYDFMLMLIDMKQYDIFDETLNRIYEKIKITSVKNLEKKVLSLKLKMLKEQDKMSEYNELAGQYIELLERMEDENRLMVSSMITLRDDYQKLEEKNKEEIKKSLRLKRQSETDPLTAMSNRLKLNEYAEISFGRAVTNGVGFAIELLDIDYFKEYNDGYGHQAGDECLLYIAKNIMELSRNHQGVFCYRYGGDEFVIIYEGFTEQEVFDLAKELKNSIVDNGLEHEHSKGDVKMVTISQGLCWGTPKDGDSIWEYMHEADQMLYKVKEKSRNSIMLGKAKHEEGDDSGKNVIKPIITQMEEEDSYLAPED